jgi:CHASE2 domain-containing sensor protein
MKARIRIAAAKTSIARFFANNKKSFRWLCVSILAVRLVELGVPLFEHLDRAFLDLFARLHARPTPSEIYLVEITDDDYKTRFGSRSPLDPKMVQTIINALEKQQPAVIGVDLDTSDPSWAGYVPSGNSTVVWAGVPTDLSSIDQEGAAFEVECPIGGSCSRFTETKGGAESRVGLVVLPEDSDGNVRQHRRDFPDALLNCTRDKRSLLPFDLAITDACSPGGSTTSKSKPSDLCQHTRQDPNFTKLLKDLFGPPKKEYFSWNGRYQFRIVSASEFLPADNEGKPGDPQRSQVQAGGGGEEETSSASPMQGRIVLLGGAYGAGRDNYWTSLGKMPGVELLAYGIYSAANGYTMPATWAPIYISSILVDFLLGSLVICITMWLGTGETKERVMAIIGAVIPLILLYETYNSNIWLGAVPVVVGVGLERVHKMKERIHDLEEENSRLRAAEKGPEVVVDETVIDVVVGVVEAAETPQPAGPPGSPTSPTNAA